MAKARVNGIEIDYEHTGRGRSILLTHGHLSSRTAWDGQHKALGDRYHVISWDIRGHGQTVSPDDPAQYSLELTIADIRALLGHLGIERVYARAAELEANGLESLESRSREVRESRSRHRSARALAHATRGILAQRDSTVIDGLPSIRVPTLVIVGDQDTPFLAPCEYMAKKIPGARLETIAGAGHSSNLDQPDAFNRILLDFLDSLSSGR